MIDQSHLHPMIVHFPIALIIVGFFSDLVGLVLKRQFFTTAGLYLYALGGIGTVAAYLSGDMAGEGVAEFGALSTALETHEGAATLALWTVMVLAVLRIMLGLMKKMTGWRQWAMVALLAGGVATIARTGYYGGELVYKHAAGVQLTFGGSPSAVGPSAEGATPGESEDSD